MKPLKKATIISLAVLAFVLAACAGSAGPAEVMPEQTEAAMEQESEPLDEPSMEETPSVDPEMAATQEMASTEESMTEEPMATQESDSMDSTSESMKPDWFDVPLTNVNTGESFTIDDFHGDVVLLETMAMWCSNCLKQQKQVKALHERLGSSQELISIGLDIDPNEEASVLQSYTEQRGFDWIYAVSPAELSRALAETYGDQFLNPPSTPILIVDRHGEVHPLRFGLKNADELLAEVEPYLNDEDM
jgi:hypothetical protein